MKELKEKLIQKARDQHRSIFPCGGKTSFEECFIVEKQSLHFFYNTEDETTHLLVEEIA